MFFFCFRSVLPSKCSRYISIRKLLIIHDNYSIVARALSLVRISRQGQPRNSIAPAPKFIDPLPELKQFPSSTRQRAPNPRKLVQLRAARCRHAYTNPRRSIEPRSLFSKVCFYCSVFLFSPPCALSIFIPTPNVIRRFPRLFL